LPKRIKNSGRSKRRDIGIRLPDHVVARALLEAMGEPLLSTSLVFPDEDELISHEADSVAERCLRWVDVMLDAEDCEPGPTSVVDCTGDSRSSCVRDSIRSRPRRRAQRSSESFPRTSFDDTASRHETDQ
jgi:tRNA A37 threonylcarbamoyladenosine synthetase subunit TsaC/SUA5/YrdC